MTEAWTRADLVSLAKAALERAGTCPENAAAVADALVDAEIDGQAGHGLRRLESYCAQVRTGKVVGAALPALERTAAATARVDAGSGFAFPALERAVSWLAETAPETGIAACAVYNSHHCGVAGRWAGKLADKGLVGLMFANTPKAIAPAGGNAPLFGTNPIAFAAPRQTDPPLVIDLSLSNVARGKIMAARQKGEAIPEGWAIDSEGRPTVDAEAALGGAMLPIGDAKGAALALMVELLAGGMTGSRFGHEASSFLDAEGAPPGTGQLLIGLSPLALGGDGFVRRLEILCDAILMQPGTRMPGSSLQQRRTQAAAAGVAVDETLIAAIRTL